MFGVKKRVKIMAKVNTSDQGSQASIQENSKVIKRLNYRSIILPLFGFFILSINTKFFWAHQIGTLKSKTILSNAITFSIDKKFGSCLWSNQKIGQLNQFANKSDVIVSHICLIENPKQWYYFHLNTQILVILSFLVIIKISWLKAHV